MQGLYIVSQNHATLALGITLANIDRFSILYAVGHGNKIAAKPCTI